MPTGQTIITNTLTKLGLLEQGGIPSASDSVYSLSELNNMWNAWGIDEGLIYAITTFTGSLSTGVGSYTIGTGATFNTARPGRIYQAFYVDATGNRNELTIVDAVKYYKHNDLAAAAATPDELYPDFNVDASGYAKLYIWPVPTFSGTRSIELNQGVNFSAWALAVNYNIPQGYQDAIEWSLASRLLPGFGAAVDTSVAQMVIVEAQQATARIRGMNAINRQMPFTPLPGTAPAAPQGA